jgi:hypothetical protein
VQSCALVLALVALEQGRAFANGTHVHITAPNGSTSSTDPTTTDPITGLPMVIPGYTSTHRYDGAPGKSSTTDTYFPTSLGGKPVTDVDGSVTTPAGNVVNFAATFAGGVLPAKFELNLGVALNSTVGPDGSLTFPVLALAGGTGDTLFNGVDLTSYASSPGSFSLGDTISFTGGTSSLVAGDLVGTSDVSFTPSTGYTTSDPFTGTAEVVALIELTPVPEPRTLAVAGLGAIAMVLWVHLQRARGRWGPHQALPA